MFFYGMTNAVLLLFLTRTLHLQPSSIGLMFGAGSIGGLLGAVVAGRVSKVTGIGPAIMGASLLRGLGLACVPLLALLGGDTVPLMVGLYAVHQFGWSIWGVTQASVRQALVPDRLQGRVTASFLLLVRATPPLGALLGGALGDWLGVPATLSLAAPGLLLATLWLVVSPLWQLHEPPQPLED